MSIFIFGQYYWAIYWPNYVDADFQAAVSDNSDITSFDDCSISCCTSSWCSIAIFMSWDENINPQKSLSVKDLDYLSIKPVWDEWIVLVGFAFLGLINSILYDNIKEAKDISEICDNKVSSAFPKSYYTVNKILNFVLNISIMVIITYLLYNTMGSTVNMVNMFYLIFNLLNFHHLITTNDGSLDQKTGE